MLLNRCLHSLSRYSLALLAVGLLQSCTWAIQSSFPYLKEHQRLEATGEEASAVILSVTQTGSTLNDQPEIELDLQVTPNEGEPYDAKTRLICPVMMIPQYQPGNTVEVKIDKGRTAVTVKGSYQQTPGLQ